MLPFEKKTQPEVPRDLNIHHQQKSQQFYFGPQNIRHIGKRTGRILRPSDHNSTFMKLSGSLDTEDYLIVQKQQLSSFSQIPRQIEPASTQMQLSKQTDLSKMTQNEELKIEQNYNVVDQKQKEVQIQIETKQNINRNIEKENRKSVDRYFAIVENSPFAVPNISNVKHRYSGGGRKSEEFLLELLRSQKNNKEKPQPTDEIIERNKEQQVIKEKQKTEQLVIHKQNKNENKRKKSQIMVDPKQKEIKQKAKSKRVTINDRGKIKLPTDSFSLQFNIVPPNQVRNDFKQIQQKQEEYHPEQQIQKQHQRSFQFKANQKKQHTQQLQRQHKPKRSIQNKRIINKTSKQKSSKSNKNKDAQNQEQRLTKKRKIDTKTGQRQQNLITQAVQPAINPNTGRPIRLKRQPPQFHKNQKTIYNSKNEVVMTGISTQLFLQILGFTINQEIKNSSIKYGSNYMQHTFRLKPKQEISSIGIDQVKLNQYLKPLVSFDKMWICPEKLGHKYLQIKIDNFAQQILDKQVFIERDQKVQVRNITQNRSCNITIGLERPANSKQKEQ